MRRRCAVWSSTHTRSRTAAAASTPQPPAPRTSPFIRCRRNMMVAQPAHIVVHSPLNQQSRTTSVTAVCVEAVCATPVCLRKCIPHAVRRWWLLTAAGAGLCTCSTT